MNINVVAAMRFRDKIGRRRCQSVLVCCFHIFRSFCHIHFMPPEPPASILLTFLQPEDLAVYTVKTIVVEFPELPFFLVTFTRRLVRGFLTY